MRSNGLLFIILFAGVSCDYAADKAHRVRKRATTEAHDMKERGKNELKDLGEAAAKELSGQADWLYFTCHPYTADTRRNRLRFHSCFDTLVVPDAKNIYCFNDYLGADFTLMFSFNCDTASLARIIRREGLVKGPGKFDSPGLEGSWDFVWWNKAQLDRMIPFVREYEAGGGTYLWYDTLNQRATYQQYSL